MIVDQGPSDFQWEDYEFGGFTPASLGQWVEDIQMDMRRFRAGVRPMDAPGSDAP